MLSGWWVLLYGARCQVRGRGSASDHLEALTEAIGFADEFEDMGAMGQAIQEGGREAFITKDLRPFSKMEVGGDDESDFFMQGGAELKDELCAGG